MAYDAELSELSAQQLRLQRVRDGLVRQGWTQGSMVCESGKVCTLGAFLLEDGFIQKRDDRWQYISDHGGFKRNSASYSELIEGYAWELGYRSSGPVVRWNDNEARTLEDVLGFFDRRIEQLGQVEVLRELIEV